MYPRLIRPLSPSEQATVVRELVPTSYFWSWETLMVWPAAAAASSASTGAPRVEAVRARREMRVAVMDFILVVFWCFGAV